MVVDIPMTVDQIRYFAAAIRADSGESADLLPPGVLNILSWRIGEQGQRRRPLPSKSSQPSSASVDEGFKAAEGFALFFKVRVSFAL